MSVSISIMLCREQNVDFDAFILLFIFFVTVFAHTFGNASGIHADISTHTHLHPAHPSVNTEYAA